MPNRGSRGNGLPESTQATRRSCTSSTTTPCSIRDYVGAIVDAFTSDPVGELGGVGGFVTDQPPHRFRRVDAWLGLDATAEGAVLPSGRSVRVYTEPREPIDVEWLPGCAMSYRRSVLATERPNLSVGRDRNGEDVELSYRVRQHWRLVVTPRARHRAPRIAAGSPITRRARTGRADLPLRAGAGGHRPAEPARVLGVGRRPARLVRAEGCRDALGGATR